MGSASSDSISAARLGALAASISTTRQRIDGNSCEITRARAASGACSGRSTCPSYWLNTQGDYRQARFTCLWPKRLRDLQQAVEAEVLRLFEACVVRHTRVGVQAPQVNDVLRRGVEPTSGIIFDSNNVHSGALQLVRQSVADATSVHENDAASISSLRCRAKWILNPGWRIEPLRWVARSAGAFVTESLPLERVRGSGTRRRRSFGGRR